MCAKWDYYVPVNVIKCKLQAIVYMSLINFSMPPRNKALPLTICGSKKLLKSRIVEVWKKSSFASSSVAVGFPRLS